VCYGIICLWSIRRVSRLAENQRRGRVWKLLYMEDAMAHAISQDWTTTTYIRVHSTIYVCALSVGIAPSTTIEGKKRRPLEVLVGRYSTDQDPGIVSIGQMMEEMRDVLGSRDMLVSKSGPRPRKAMMRHHPGPTDHSGHGQRAKL
jgi:hypothetical protein